MKHTLLSSCFDISRTLFQVPTDADSFESFMSRVRSSSSLCVKGTGWLLSSPSTTIGSLCLESELYSMLPSGSEIGRSGSWGTGQSNRKNVRVLDVVLVLAIYSFYLYHSEKADRNGIFPSFQTIGIANGIFFLLPFLQSFKFSAHVLLQTWGVNDLSWSPCLTQN